MMPGLGLTSDAAAQPYLALLHSRIVVDASGRYNARVLSNVLLPLVGLAIFLFFPGYTGENVLIACGVWLAFFGCYLFGLCITRYRRARHLSRFSAGLEA